MNNWNEKEDGEEFIVYGKNIGYDLCIDERGLRKGEVYRMVRNGDKDGGKGRIVGIVKGSKGEDVMNVVVKIDGDKGKEVKEIRVDMGGSMEKIGKGCFGGGMEVVDGLDV